MESRRRRAVARLIGIALPMWLAAGVAACGDEGDASSTLSPEAASGRQIVARAGCAACHGADGGGGIGPAWAEGLGTEVELEDGTTVTVDETYLTRSIAEPGAQVHAGFTVQMPQNQLTDEEIADVVAYIVELNGSAKAADG